MRRLVLSALAAFLAALPAMAQEGPSLLDRVAKNYRDLQGIEISGTLSSQVPDIALTIHVKSDFAVAPPSIFPAKKAAEKPFTVRRHGSVTFTDPGGQKQRAPGNLGPISMPGNFGGDEKLNQDVKNVSELPRETLNLSQESVSCRVLQVEYDRPGWRPEESVIKYWIDETRMLILKEEFSEVQRHDRKSTLWHWVYEAKSIKVDRPPPDWLVEFAKRSATQSAGRQLNKWIGKNAPDFSLVDLSDHSVSLSAMKGSVVVLNFWATWCAPCMAEMPTIAKVANGYKTKGVAFWGLSTEQPAALKKWLAHNQASFTIVVDKEGYITEDYHTEGIPALVVVGRDGKIHSFYSGPQDEQSLRAAIDEALR